MAAYSNILEASATTTPLTEAACSGTHSVETTVTVIGNQSAYSNVLTVYGATLVDGYSSNILTLDENTLPLGYASNILSLDAVTQPTFGIDAVDQYVHGETTVLSVYGITDTYTVRWSPSNATPNAPGSVELTVETDNLDGSGNGTIDITADRGIVRYLDTGYVWIVQGTAFNNRAAQLALPTGYEYVVLTNPLVAPEFRITAIPDLDVGDMLIWFNVSPSGDVSIEPDGSFNASLDVQSFDVEVHVANLGYGDAVTQDLVGTYEFLGAYGASHTASLTKRVSRILAHTSASSSDADRGLPSKNVGVSGTHGSELILATTAERARAFSSQTSLDFSYQVTIETPFSVQINETFGSVGTLGFDIDGITKPTTVDSNHGVAFSYTALDAVPTITQVQPMTHGIQSIIIGINFGN